MEANAAGHLAGVSPFTAVVYDPVHGRREGFNAAGAGVNDPCPVALGCFHAYP
jgi:hypothetical protein